MLGLRPLRRSGISALPITDFVAPVSRMPCVSLDENIASSCWESSETLGGTLTAWMQGGIWLCISLLGSGMFPLDCQNLDNLPLRLSLTPLDLSLTPLCPLKLNDLPLRETVVAKAVCILGSSSVDSWISGSCRNSSGRNSSSGTAELSTGTAVKVGADGAPLDEVEVRDLSGHSAFQWPLRPQRRHEVSIMRC